MKIESINLSEIIPYENNAKLHPKEQIQQIVQSIKKFGNNDPIAIDENNVIIEGHGRYQALKELGYEEVEVIKLTHLSEEQKKAYILAHNKLTMNTGFDIDILQQELDGILDIDMSEFGFDIEMSLAADNVMKPGAVFYIWHADSEGYNFRGACFDIGWTVRQCLIWNKNSMVLGRQDYHWKHEPCLYGWKEGAGHLWASDRKQTTVIDFDKPQRNGEHPTMKPVGLFDYQILNNTKGGDIVLDLFGGSGTTIMACEQNGRSGYLMELDPRYVDVIIRRWETFTGERAVLLN